MNRGIFILIAALALAVTAYAICFEAMTRPAHALLAEPNGKLEWLRREFNLTDPQFARITALHDAYSSVCGSMCERIVVANSRLDELVAKNREVTPDVDSALRECAKVRADCNTALLRHIYAVAAEMSPESGKRYIEMMTKRITQPAPWHSKAMAHTPK
jgi:hypothetical protein